MLLSRLRRFKRLQLLLATLVFSKAKTRRNQGKAFLIHNIFSVFVILAFVIISLGTLKRCFALSSNNFEVKRYNYSG